MTSDGKYLGQQEPAHPELFEKPPEFISRLEPWALTEEQVKQWYEQGFIVLEKLFDPEELAPIKDCAAGLVDEVADILYRTGRVKQTYSECGFYERLTKLTQEFPHTVLALFKISAKRFPKEISDLWGHKKLTTVAGQLLGTMDIKGHPVWTVRPKIPETDLAVAPWHQDSGYFDTESYRHIIISAWIPLLNATTSNGCLQFLPGGHKDGKIVDHRACWKDTFYLDIKDETFQRQLGRDISKEAIFAEVPFGGVVLFNNYLPHRSNPHKGDIRWACDFRYMKTDAPGCFHGIGNGIQLSSATDPDYKPDWEGFKNQAKRRYVVTAEDKVSDIDADEDLFDMDMGGVWMERWERFDNRYTKLYDERKKKQEGKTSA